MLANNPIMAMTTKSSIKVKPDFLKLLIILYKQISNKQ